jgi:Bacterial Ig-like domain (group 2)
MFDRRYLKGVLLLGLALSLADCSSPSLVSISISPATTYFGGVGATEQLTATGTYAQGNQPKTTQNITDEVTWATSATSVATVTSTGVVTSTNTGGSAVIYARMNGFTGLITGTAQAIDCPSLSSSGSGCGSTP